MTKVRVKGALPLADNYVVEVFSASTCDAASSIACNDDSKPGQDLRPEATFATVAGQTYFIALGVISAPSGMVPALKVDD